MQINKKDAFETWERFMIMLISEQKRGTVWRITSILNEIIVNFLKNYYLPRISKAEAGVPSQTAILQIYLSIDIGLSNKNKWGNMHVFLIYYDNLNQKL